MITHLHDIFSSYMPKELPTNNLIPAAVTIMFRHSDGSTTNPQIVFVKKVEDGSPHSGQIAFPGGKKKKHETYLQAAVREAQEEVGLQEKFCNMVGRLDDMNTLTGFHVRPFIFHVHTDHPEFVRQEEEIDEIFTIPWYVISDTHQWDQYIWTTTTGVTLSSPALHWQNYTIWGLTAFLLKQLQKILDEHNWTSH